MSDPQSAASAADREAAEWHVRLGKRPVSADSLQAFKTWRQIAGNAEAYHEVERLWRSAGSLASDSDIQAMTRAALQTSKARPRQRRFRLRRLFPMAGVLAAAVAVAVALSLWPPQRGVYATDVGEGRVFALADGSQVQLDTDTRVRVRFGKTERRITLEQGQALFTVAHDAARPFRVDAGVAEVTALGTVFDVRRDPKGVRVTLLEGSAAVIEREGGARNWRLTPGHQVQTARPRSMPVAVDAAAETSWSQGRLVFRGAPLREAVAEVNRYLPEKIVLDDGPTSMIAVSGVFATGDRDAFVAAVSDLFDLSAQDQLDGGVLLTAPSVAR